MSKTLAAALACLVLFPASAAASDIGVIAYTSDRDGNPEVYTSRVDGYGQTNLTQNPAVDQSPAFSAQGDRIAFISNRDGRMDVWVMNVDGSNPQKVTTGDPNTSEAEPAWSPDGTTLVFSSTRAGDGAWHLFTVDVASGAVTRLTTGWGVQPAWSPDGTRIAYTGASDLIHVMNADGTNDYVLNACCLGPEGSATWSPSGGNIVFGRYDSDWQTTNIRQLYIEPATGGTPIPITSGAYYYGHPAFSPDGSMLVFQRQEGAFGSPELYFMKLSDLVPYPSVTGPGANFVPAWGPTFVPPAPPPPPPDTTPPTITLNRPTAATDQYDVYTVGQVVRASYSCADEPGGSGLRQCFGTVANGSPIDTRSVGLFDFYVFAADNAGNPVYKWTKYRVVYPFSGFFAPLTGGLNDLRAGDSAPLKFSLGADYGLDIVTSATQQQEDCASGAVRGSAGSALGALTYNASQGRYLYDWSSDKSWAGTCRAVTLTLRDGTAHRADFRLGK